MKQYSIGIDFGSLSARGVLMDLESGEPIASDVFAYPHGIMRDQLPDGTPLPMDWALQDPADYWDALHAIVPPLLEQCGILPAQVVGLGLDTTSCTMLPTKADGTPLCALAAYQNRPHAYVKLWKHHAAQAYADQINRLMEGTPGLAQYGGVVSGEHYLPKALQLAVEDPALYQAADRLLEIGDWLVYRLCGREVRSYCYAAYKEFYSRERGDLSPAILEKFHPLLRELNKKHPGPVVAAGLPAGSLTPEAAAWVGLLPGTPVAAGGIDAQVTVPGCHICDSGNLLMIIGTSTCEILLSDVYRELSGISGVVRDGILPGFSAYAAGQSCVGDLFDWFVRCCVPASYAKEAADRGENLHQLLTEKAARLKAGQSGLVALDWWNGVRSVLMDFSLSGLIVGQTLDTRPEEQYRALLEATAYGANQIIETMERGGVEIKSLWAAGGIPSKNPLLLQIYADVCNRDVYLVEQEQTGALGSAILGAAAAGSSVTGFTDINEMVRSYQKTDQRKVYHPNSENAAVYAQLYPIYCELYQYFGRESALMHQLREIKRGAAGRAQTNQNQVI